MNTVYGRDFYSFKDYIVQKGDSVHVQMTDHGQDVRSHDHDCTELVMVLRGQGLHDENGETWELQRGDVFAVPLGKRHAYRNVQGLRIVDILVDLERLRPALEGLWATPPFRALLLLEPASRQRTRGACRLRLEKAALTQAESLVAAMLEEQNESRSGRQAMLVGLFLQLLSLFLRGYGQASRSHTQALLRVSGLLEYMDAHLDERMTLRALAGRAGMSRRTLLRVFRHLLNTTPVQYLQDIRIDRACALLQSRPDLNVTQVAFAVGFNDSAYFCRTFSRHTGLPPHRWRKQGRMSATDALRA